MRHSSLKFAGFKFAFAALGAAIAMTMGLAPVEGAAPATTPTARAQAAFKAMGLSDQYVGEGTRPTDMVVTLTTRATMRQWDPGESMSVSDLMSPDGGASTFVQRWDRGRDFVRNEWVRPRPGGAARTYTEIVMPDGGYVMGNDANGAMTRRTIQGTTPLHTMSGLRLRTLLREQERIGLLYGINVNLGRLSEFPAQTVAGKRYPAVQYRGENATFIVMYDPQSNLPAVVRTRDFDHLMGDADFDAIMTDWRAVEGVKMPHQITYTLNGVKVFETTVNSYELNGTLPSDAYIVPAPLRGKAALPAPIGKVPYQWVLRRLASGFYLDSDALYSDDGGQLALTDAGPNMSLVTGGSHNTLIVATPQYLVAFDAPGDDGLSQKTIEMAKAKYPGKSFRYLVLTHHHIDHTGGLRAYIADGATLVVGKGNGAFFRKTLSAAAGLNYTPVQGRVTPKVIEADQKWTVNDGGRVIEAYALDNPHAAGYLVPYVPDAKLGFVTDLWNPGPIVAGAANPNMIAFVRGLEKAGVQPEKIAGGHGAIGNYADLARLVGNAR